MNALSSNYELHKARNPPAIHGTCSWILSHPKVQAWATSPRRSLLWHSANAGCGKSVTASFLVDHFKQNTQTDADVCHFFFKDDSVEQSNATTGLSALLHQLFAIHPNLIKIAREQLSIPGNTLASIDTLWRTLLKAVHSSEANSTTICVVDGLDECDEVSRKQLMALMADYFKPSTTKVEEKRLKMVVLSRPDNSIQMMFDRHTSKPRKTAEVFESNMLRLRGEDETNSINQDIELVIQDAMQALEDGGIPEDLLEEIERELVGRADRTFLWITLIIQLLKDKAVEGASRREMNAILRSRSVYSIYTAMLDAKTGNTPAIKQKARKMLSIILAATRPLTIEELNIALAIKPDLDALAISESRPKPSRRTFRSVQDELVYPPENHIKSLCGHFVRIIQGKVYLVHQTAREFLLDQQSAKSLFDMPHGFSNDDSSSETELWEFSDSGSEDNGPSRAVSVLSDVTKVAVTVESESLVEPGWQHSFSVDRCRASLLEVCTAFLYMLGKPCRDVALGKPSEKVEALLQYAASCWVIHFHQVCERIHPANIPYYHGLCHPRFPGFKTWLEAYDNEGREPFFLAQSADEQQDTVIDRFALEPGHPRFGKDFTAKVNLTRALSGDSSHQPIISCNPSQAQKLNFPMKVDETGHATLDFERVGQRGHAVIEHKAYTFLSSEVGNIDYVDVDHIFK